MKTITYYFLFLFIFSFSIRIHANDNVRIYELDCGHINFKELSYFSDTGDYDGKKGQMKVSCFLIKHPKGWLMWDTGLTQTLMGKPDTNVIGATESVLTGLESQLKILGLNFSDIKLVSFSHMHADHSGNADLFKSSTWILQQKEFDYATRVPPPIGMDPKNYSKLKDTKKILIDGDYDVFGDGLVKLFATPGHTPGHQSLIINLKKSGHLIFAGDTYHFNASRKYKRVPIFNTSRAETIASIDRIDQMAKSKKAKIIIQHETHPDFKFPAFPLYLE